MAERLSRELIREAPLLRADQDVRSAMTALLDSSLPALPVVDEKGRLCGIFGEREFFGALFPGYLKTLSGAGFVRKPVDDHIEKRAECATEPIAEHMNRERVEAEAPPSDVQLAETFLHHEVLIVPVTEDGRVTGVVTRGDFFRALAERFGDLTG